MLIDSHAHLDMEQFDPDRDEVVCRAQTAGVGLILTIATGKPGDLSVEKTLRLVEKFDLLYAAVGVHPHDAQWADDGYFDSLARWAQHAKVILWGEIGLDYYYDHSPRDIQRRVLCRQLEMAQHRMLPVAIHCRDAWPDLMEILRRQDSRARRGGIIHSFTGTKEQALECVDLGYMISFSGILTFKKAGPLREVAKALPLNRILVETDSPFLAPHPHRGKRNEPAFVQDVARCLAEARGLPFEELAAGLSTNFCELTGLQGLAQQKLS
jgi:TatD DNase family protein